MKKLSVAIATFNEEENIGDCLNSVQRLADEIVVVDGDSVDKTVQIAKKYGARVISTTNKTMFHTNKQMAIDACKGKWILQLDADERVSSGLKKEIIKVTSHKTKFSGFWIPRKNYFLGRYLTKGGQYPDYTLRLYRRGKGRLPCKSVHEQAVVDGETGYLKNDLLHLADPSFSRYLMRFDRYTSLMANKLAKKGVKIGVISGVDYLFYKPLRWFLLTYFRHKGFVDGFPGLVFSFFSSLRFMVAYIKYWEKGRDESSY